MKAVDQEVSHRMAGFPTFAAYPHHQPPAFGASAGMAPAYPPMPASMAAGNIAPHHPSFSTAMGMHMPAAQPHPGPLRKRNHEVALAVTAEAADAASAALAEESHPSSKRIRTTETAEKRTKRLEQNRLAAIESRRRKKHMEEELKRSVTFYTKANCHLKSQNVELERQLLVAKEKVLLRQQGRLPPFSSEGVTSTATSSAVKTNSPQPTVSVAPPKESQKPAASQVQAQPTAIATRQPTITSSFTNLFGSTSNAEMERQAQQAQFAATQALYKSMGYPAGAARVAASTFSQFVGQTGVLPAATKVTAVPTKGISPVSNIAAVSVPTPAQQQAVPNSTPLVPTKPASSDEYIGALHKFAMQQAAAANAAAAAASAAIQAVNMHSRLKSEKGAVSSAPAPVPMSVPSSMPFSFAPAPAGMRILPREHVGVIDHPCLWPFQNQLFFAKEK